MLQSLRRPARAAPLNPSEEENVTQAFMKYHPLCSHPSLESHLFHTPILACSSPPLSTLLRSIPHPPGLAPVCRFQSVCLLMALLKAAVMLSSSCSAGGPSGMVAEWLLIHTYEQINKGRGETNFYLASWQRTKSRPAKNWLKSQDGRFVAWRNKHNILDWKEMQNNQE